MTWLCWHVSIPPRPLFLASSVKPTSQERPKLVAQATQTVDDMKEMVKETRQTCATQDSAFEMHSAARLKQLDLTQQVQLAVNAQLSHIKTILQKYPAGGV